MKKEVIIFSGIILTIGLAILVSASGGNFPDFEDCASLSDWSVTPAGAWTIVSGQCKGGFLNPFGNMTSNFTTKNLAGYAFANLSFIYSHSNLTSTNGKFIIYARQGVTETIIFERNTTNPGGGIGAVTNAQINVSINQYMTLGNNMTFKAECRSAAGTRTTCNWDNINLTYGGIAECNFNAIGIKHINIPCDCQITSNQDGSSAFGSGDITFNNNSVRKIVEVRANLTNWIFMDIHPSCAVDFYSGTKYEGTSA